MRIIIAGSRNCNDYNLLKEVMEQAEQEGFIPKTILSGGATGIDKLGERYAKEFGINLEIYPAKWKDIKGKPKNEIKQNKYGKYWSKAGLARNEQMAQEADALIAISLNTPGTEHMVSTAYKYKLKVYEYRPETEECFGFNFWEE